MWPSRKRTRLPLPSSVSQIQKPQPRRLPMVVQDLQPVKTYSVFSVHTTSCNATFPQLRTNTRPSVVRAAVEKQKSLTSFTWEHCESLMWYWWKAPPRRLIDFHSLLWRISESLVFVQRFIRNKDENLLSGECCRDQRYAQSFLLKQREPCCEDVCESFRGWNDQTELQTLGREWCPVVQTLEWEEKKHLAFYVVSPWTNDSTVFFAWRLLHVGPKRIGTVQNV